MSAVDGLVEKVARALSRAIDGHGDTERVEQQRVDHEWGRYREHAKIAVAAIDQHREEAVLEAINDYLAMTGAVLTHRSLSGPSDDDLRVGLAEHIADAIVGPPDTLSDTRR